MLVADKLSLSPFSKTRSGLSYLPDRTPAIRICRGPLRTSSTFRKRGFLNTRMSMVITLEALLG